MKAILWLDVIYMKVRCAMILCVAGSLDELGQINRKDQVLDSFADLRGLLDFIKDDDGLVRLQFDIVYELVPVRDMVNSLPYSVGSICEINLDVRGILPFGKFLGNGRFANSPGSSDKERRLPIFRSFSSLQVSRKFSF